MSDDFIYGLAADIRPVPTSTLPRRIFVGALAGAAISAVIMFFWIGLRPDFPGAFVDGVFWLKAAYTTGFALLGLWAVERLSRPGGSIRYPAMGFVALVAVAAIAGIVQLLMSPPEAARALVLGSTALVCPFYILALALPIYVVAILVMRRLAPTNLTLAGFAAGMLAGGASSWVYAFHCGESGLAFVSIWYTGGVLVSALIGMLAGRYLLRW